MQPGEANPSIDNKPKKEKLECSCFTKEDCEQHDLTPQKRFTIMEEAIDKVQKLADGQDNAAFTSEEYMLYFSCAFFFSSIRYYGSYTGKVYEKFVSAFYDNIVEVILPSLEGKENAVLLTKIMEMWAKYKILAHWLLRFFEPLRAFCSLTRGADISDVPYMCFCDWVFDQVWNRSRGMVMRWINQERAGRVVDRVMIKAAIDLFVEIDHKGKRFYYKNFEQLLLTDIDARCTKLSQEWLSDCSFDEYLEKALDCIQREERRMAYYLPQNTMRNVVEVMSYELMDRQSRAIAELLFRGGQCHRGNN